MLYTSFFEDSVCSVLWVPVCSIFSWIHRASCGFLAFQPPGLWLAKVVQGYSCWGFLTNVGKWERGVQFVLGAFLTVAVNVAAERWLHPVGVPGKDTGIQINSASGWVCWYWFSISVHIFTFQVMLCLCRQSRHTGNKYPLRRMFPNTFFTEMKTSVLLILAHVSLICVYVNV